ncbi:MAG: 2-amino-4-hydroxy-6-hydroxymethyldihydropteridine diphosphokinase [Tannerella sp.]|nr:2-amino-4-hydroxy-6-hydroxymethyldihydropteridine diphosphokinase [Tannerella sp.]
MSFVYLGLGSNLGDKRRNIKKALTLMIERVGDILALSDFYETSSWGYDSTEMYLNTAVKLETELKPEELLAVTQEIEREIGRRGKTVNGKYQDRIIDIDVLLYDDLMMRTPKLTIPHPLLHRRIFVLQPLFEIAPDVVHPVLKKTIADIYHLMSEHDLRN